MPFWLVTLQTAPTAKSSPCPPSRRGQSARPSITSSQGMPMHGARVPQVAAFVDTGPNALQLQRKTGTGKVWRVPLYLCSTVSSHVRVGVVRTHVASLRCVVGPCSLRAATGSPPCRRHRLLTHCTALRVLEGDSGRAAGDA